MLYYTEGFLFSGACVIQTCQQGIILCYCDSCWSQALERSCFADHVHCTVTSAPDGLMLYRLHHINNDTINKNKQRPMSFYIFIHPDGSMAEQKALCQHCIYTPSRLVRRSFILYILVSIFTRVVSFN